MRAPEGTVGDIDVHGQGLVEFVIENWTKRSEDTLERFNTSAEVETLFATLEEGLLDLCVLSRWELAHNMVEEVDRVNALGGPGGLTVQEGLKTAEVDLAGPAEMNGVLVPTSAGPGLPTLFGIEIDGDAAVVTRKALARPTTC